MMMILDLWNKKHKNNIKLNIFQKLWREFIESIDYYRKNDLFVFYCNYINL